MIIGVIKEKISRRISVANSAVILIKSSEVSGIENFGAITKGIGFMAISRDRLIWEDAGRNSYLDL